MMFNTVINYILMFFIFSSIGWAIESTYRSLGEKKIINSGFLYGPICPIYGAGCLAFDICLVPISVPIEKRIIIVLLLGMLLADIVEYVTSYVMEKLFNARWWDYSNNFLNLHGRICFKHTCYWAIFAFIYVYLVSPIYNYVLGFIPQNIRTIAVFVILAVFAVDLTVTVKAVADINKLMKKMTLLKQTVIEKTELLKNTAEDKYSELISSGGKFNEWKNDINRQYFDIISQYKELGSAGHKSTNRLLSLYSTIRKTADDALREIESAWNDIKNLFSDSEDEMM